MPAIMSINGNEDIIEKLELLGANVSKRENEALTAAAAPVMEDAKLNIQSNGSVRTGDLLESIEISKPKKRRYKYKYIAIFTKDPVAHLVELGHGGPTPAPAHTFLGPALEKNKRLIEEIIAEKLREALK